MEVIKGPLESIEITLTLKCNLYSDTQIGLHLDNHCHMIVRPLHHRNPKFCHICASCPHIYY